MTWIKLDDRAPRHPKIDGLSDRAFRWWIKGLCYASEFLTDGDVSGFCRTVPSKTRVELFACGLWFADGERVMIHDYLEHQSSREYVLSERAFETRRAAMRRDPALRDEIQARDGDRCRYCGRRVSWLDRKSIAGATYDHVIPRGPETVDNLVVACRGCNSKKRNRTPEEAEMHLLPPRTVPDKSRSESGPEIREQRSERDPSLTLPQAGGRRRRTSKRAQQVIHRIGLPTDDASLDRQTDAIQQQIEAAKRRLA